jgi:hypothetical protein
LIGLQRFCKIASFCDAFIECKANFLKVLFDHNRKSVSKLSAVLLEYILLLFFYNNHSNISHTQNLVLLLTALKRFYLAFRFFKILVWLLLLGFDVFCKRNIVSSVLHYYRNGFVVYLIYETICRFNFAYFSNSITASHFLSNCWAIAGREVKRKNRNNFFMQFQDKKN